MKLVVRPFAKADVEPSFDLWAAAWRLALPEEDIDRLLPGWRRQFLEEHLPRAAVLAADCDGALTGFAIVWPEKGWLDQLIVAPDRHRRGVGRHLVAAALDLTGGRLEFRVVQTNAGAVAFYEALGFERTGAAESPATGWPSWTYRWPIGRRVVMAPPVRAAR